MKILSSAIPATLVLIAAFGSTSLLQAQSERSFETGVVGDQDDPSLPPVIVRPGQSSGDGESGESQSGESVPQDGTLPPVLVQPSAGSGSPSLPANDSGQPSQNNFDQNADFSDNNVDASATPNFPSLSDQALGGFDGGLRGSSSSLFDSPQSIDLINRQTLSERSPIDIGQALEQTPGVLVQRTGRGQSSPFVRGLTGQQVLVLVDGVRMTNATFRAGPNQYFNLVDPNMVDRVEVIRGSGAVLYGADAVGGVINIITKSPEDRGGDFLTSGTIQRFSSADLGYNGRLSLEGWVGSLGAFGGASYGNFNNVDVGGSPDAPPGFDAGGRQQATSWRYHSADIKLNYQLTPLSQVVVGVQHFQAEDVFRSDRFPANRESIFGPQIRDLYYVRLQGTTPWAGGFADQYQITGSLHRFDETRADRDFRSGRNPLLISNREFVDEQTGLNISFVKELGYWGTVSYGLDWYHDEIDSSRTDVDESTTPATVTSRDGAIPNDAYYSRYGGFVNWDVFLTDRLAASTGVRYEHITAGATVTASGVTGRIDPEYQDFVGHVGLSYAVGPRLRLVGSISEAFRAPNIDDLATINDNVFVGTQLPNPSLAPENSITYEVGAKFDGQRFRGQTFVWWNDLNDLIVRSAPNDMLLLERTNADAYLNGVETSGEFLLSDQWSVYGNAWYTYGQNTTADEPLSRIPPLQGTLGLRRRWNNGNDWFDVYAWMVDHQDRLSARDISDVNRIPPGGTPAFTTLNFRVGRLVTPRQRVSLNVENLLDQQYRVHGSGTDGAGINAIVTYEILR